jgi:hypothetical protein
MAPGHRHIVEVRRFTFSAPFEISSEMIFRAHTPIVIVSTVGRC